MALKEPTAPAVAPAAGSGRQRNWWYPLRMAVTLAAGLPFLLMAALLSAAMGEPEDG